MRFHGPEIILLLLALGTGDPLWLWLTILYQAVVNSKENKS